MHTNQLPQNIREHLNPILYILNKAGKPVNRYNILKILYFADQICLVKYNQEVVTDWFEKQEYGPVAYHTYDLLKAAEGRNDFISQKLLNEYIVKVDKHSFKALKKVDLDEFSTIQMECLDQAIVENVDLTFEELLNKSHDDAYRLTEDLFDEIDKYTIAKAGGANDEQIAYMKEMDEIGNAEWV